MPVNELEIVIGSTVGDAVKGLNQVDKATDKLSADTNKAASSISKSYTQINNASKTLVKSNQQLSKTVVNSSGTLTSFSRIVQDAPFGIIGVGNNITQFAEQFQYLQRQTGSAGTALAALGKSLLGVGGITFGISILITGITTLTQKYGSLGAAVEAILNPLNEQQRIQKAVNDTMRESAQDAQTEIASLDALYRATQNINVPLSERNKIIDQLQKQFPSYFGNLSNEAILTGKGASAYENLRIQILRVAQAKAISEKIGDISAKQLEIDEKRVKALQRLATAEKNATRVNEEFTKSQENANNIGAGAIQRIDNFQAAALSLGSAIVGLKGEIEDLDKEDLELSQTVDRLISKQDSLVVQFGAQALGIKEVTSSIKKLKQEITKLDISAVSTAIDPFIANAQIVQQRAQEELNKNPLKAIAPIDIELVGLKAASERAASQIGEFKNTIVENVNSINIDVERILQQGAATIASGIGNAIGLLVSGAGGLQDAFNAIVGVFGDFLSQLGQSLIAAGTATIAAEALATNPFTAIAAGVLAVAAGAAVRAALKNTPSFATGGSVVGGPTLAMIGDNPGREEYVIPSEVLDKIGGGGSGFIAETRLSGTDILIAVRRAMGNSNRANG